MNLKKAFHHEGHKDHEDFSWGCIALNARPQGDWHSRNDLLAFFVFFVPFVVQLQF